MARRAGDRSWRRWIMRLGAAALLAAGAATLPYHLLGEPSRDPIDRMRADLEKTRAAVRAQRAANADLSREIDALKNDPGAIEDLARRDRGMVRPGELVLRFDGTPEAP